MNSTPTPDAAAPQLLLLVPLVLGTLMFVLAIKARARRFGYPSMLAYLTALPRSDEERRDASALAMQGIVCCLLGLIVPPLVLIGLVPLVFAARKMFYGRARRG